MALCCENQDTKDLLKYCNEGCKMATNSIEQVMEYVKDNGFRKTLQEYDQRHAQLGEKCNRLLQRFHLEEEDPSVMAKAMSYLSTQMKMLVNRDEQEIAKIMMDGCNMGIQSLCKYLNQYTQADGECRKVTEDLVDAEFAFMKDLRAYL